MGSILTLLITLVIIYVILDSVSFLIHKMGIAVSISTVGMIKWVNAYKTFDPKSGTW